MLSIHVQETELAQRVGRIPWEEMVRGCDVDIATQKTISFEVAHWLRSLGLFVMS